MITKLITIVVFSIIVLVAFGHEGGGAIGVVLMLWLVWELIKIGCRVLRGAYRMGGR